MRSPFLTIFLSVAAGITAAEYGLLPPPAAVYAAAAAALLFLYGRARGPLAGLRIPALPEAWPPLAALS